MRRYFERIQVEVDKRGTPACIVWRGCTYMVARLLDHWRYVGKWWRGEGHVVRNYYRVELRAAAFGRRVIGEPRSFELFKQNGQWTLTCVYD